MGLTESEATYDEGEDSTLSAVLEDDQATPQPIPYANLTWARLTLTDALTGLIVNARDDVSIKNDNDVQIHATNGSMLWAIQPADVLPANQELPWAEHKAEFSWEYVLDGEPKIGGHTHRMRIRNFTQLCTVADVREFYKSMGKADEFMAEWLVDVVSRAWERRTQRRIRTSIDPNPTTIIYSPGEMERSLPCDRYPITSIVDIVEEPYGRWASGSIMSPDNYTFSQGLNFCRIIARDTYFTPGVNSTRVRLYGGLTRDTAGVDPDLRFMAARQAAFWLQRKDQLGLTSISAPGSFSTTVQRFEKNLLPEVVDVFDAYATAWI